MSTLLPLLGKRCLISGGSRGIGLAIAQKFAMNGATCVLVARNPQTLEEAVSTLPSIEETVKKHNFLAGNVGDPNFWQRAAIEEPDVNILVNAAGIAQSSLLVSTPWEKIDDILQTNLSGPIYSSKAFIRNMIRRREVHIGCIINVSSVLAIRGGKGSTVYAASKAGLLGLSRALADEVSSSGIRVNMILPGYIATDMTEKMSKQGQDAAVKSTPLKRFGTVEEVAQAALFLVTNNFCTGSVVTVDGGLST